MEPAIAIEEHSLRSFADDRAVWGKDILCDVVVVDDADAPQKLLCAIERPRECVLAVECPKFLANLRRGRCRQR